MAQPAQIKGLGPSGEFIVIDNGAAGVTSTNGAAYSPGSGGPPTGGGSGNWTGPGAASGGFDLTAGGAVAQDQNSFGNGTIPDAANPTAFTPVVPTIAQKANGASTGSVASLAVAFGSNNIVGNSIVVVCGVGNGTAPTITDSQTNSYSQVVQIANGTAFNVAIFVAVNCKAGANTVTVNNGGTTASIAAEIYEFGGLVTVSNTAVVDNTGSNQGAATTTSPVVTVNTSQANSFALAAFGLGTAAQTITAGASYNNDSGQLNPTTPAGLFSFVSASLDIASAGNTSPTATVGVAEPWAVAAATFKAFTPVSTLKSGLVVLNTYQGPRVYFKNPA